MKIKVIFDYHDLWIGVYWKIWRDFSYNAYLKIYICLIPMFPIYIRIKI